PNPGGTHWPERRCRYAAAASSESLPCSSFLFVLRTLQARADKVADRLHEMRQIGAQPVKPGQAVQRALVHVERAVDLDLEAVAVLARTPLAAHDLDPFIALVDEHVIWAELAVIDRDAGPGVPAHEADTGNRARLERRRKRTGQHARVEIVRRAVGVEIAAREQGSDQCRAQRRR